MSTVSPLPFQGGVFRDSRDENRWLRVSWHEERRMFVVSIWHIDECIAAFQLGTDDVPGVVQAFLAAIPTS
jgi:hypothetical protein